MAVSDGVMKILVGLEACCQVRRINAFAGNACCDEFEYCRIGREESSLRGIALGCKPGGKYSARLARRALARLLPSDCSRRTKRIYAVSPARSGNYVGRRHPAEAKVANRL